MTDTPRRTYRLRDWLPSDPGIVRANGQGDVEACTRGDAMSIVADMTAKDRLLWELADATEWLVDLQNGPPLPKTEERWNQTMARCRELITRVKGEQA